MPIIAEHESDDLFAWSLYRAIKRCRELSSDVDHDTAPEPPPPPSLSLDAKLPPGVTRHKDCARIYAYVYLPRSPGESARKIVFPTMPETAEAAALAGRVAWAARQCRDRGGDEAQIRAAGLAVLRERNIVQPVEAQDIAPLPQQEDS